MLRDITEDAIKLLGADPNKQHYEIFNDEGYNNDGYEFAAMLNWIYDNCKDRYNVECNEMQNSIVISLEPEDAVLMKLTFV